ncbi:IS701 family transposase [Limnoglobus roseus]|uniref:IS701 family transposase n=1 Tax=Limnoglobus roseus TaxID=2598579 RepID=A0A5C1AF26_9BACT|nr:IS701 family transposase [Limnoglobus roseus]QEL16823.1 IS701 family transposase [Limnoglobus roseus]
MTDSEIAAIGSEFGRYLRRYRTCFGQDRTAAHFDTYCRGLLSDLPRKSVEPVALASGTAVRTLQEFLTTAAWDHESARDVLQRHLAGVLTNLPTDPLGTVGVIDETSCLKKGDRTPGVQRQYLGCAGKVDNGIVTVHVGVAKGQFQALLDADLYLPKSWAEDRDRCRAAGIPDDVRHVPKWRIALDQVLRLDGNGVRFDWLVFDEGYGAAVPFLTVLTLIRQKFVAEVPVNFSVRATNGGKPRRADTALAADAARQGRRFRLTRRTVQPQVWRAAGKAVWVRGKAYRLVVAINESTAEVKYFVTNATAEPLSRVLAVAFRRATIEHSFRAAKSEAGLMHYEGRQYTGLIRHLILALLVMGFVSAHTDRLRGKKPAGDDGAGVPGTEREVRRTVPPPARDTAAPAHGRGHPVPPTAERAGRQVPQEAAA